LLEDVAESRCAQHVWRAGSDSTIRLPARRLSRESASAPPFVAGSAFTAAPSGSVVLLMTEQSMATAVQAA